MVHDEKRDSPETARAMDLAALKLEEAFDHMDLVIKHGDMTRIERAIRLLVSD